MEPEDREEDRSLLTALEADAARRLQFPWDKSLSSELLDNLGRYVYQRLVALGLGLGLGLGVGP